MFTEQMLRNGEVEMQAKDEEIRFLKMQLTEDKRTLNLTKRTLPSKKAMEQEVVSLQIEVIPSHEIVFITKTLIKIILSVFLDQELISYRYSSKDKQQRFSALEVIL